MLKNISPYSLLYIVLRLAGFMPNKGRIWSSIYSTYQLSSVTIFGVLGFLEIILGNDNLKELILTVSAITIFIQIYVKHINFVVNEKKIREFLARLANYRSELLEEKDNRNQITAADNLCKNTIIYFNIVFLGFHLISYISNFVTDYSTNFNNPHLIHQCWIPWKMNDFWPYCAGTILVLLITLSCATVYTSITCIQLLFTFQMSAYLKILQNNIETKGPKDKMVYYHHSTLIRLLKEYNKLFSAQIYVEILVGSLEPCGFGYAMIRSFRRYEPAALDLLNKMLLCLVTPLILCSCGQEIGTQMENLHLSAYMNNWYEENPKIRRNLFTMMETTIRPMTMNYRLFVKFDYECYSTVIQGIYSYLMMIINFDNSD